MNPIIEAHIAVGITILSVVVFLFKTRHRHTWKAMEAISIWDRSISTDMPIGRKYTMQCTTCGKLKSERL